MSELILTLTGVVAFALIHAAHPRRFPAGEARWNELARPLGSAPRALHALAIAISIVGVWGRGGSYTAAEALLVFSFALMAAGSALVMAVPLWPRWTWRACAACAAAWPLLLIAQVLHG
jgi:hypothetical protein